MLYKGKSKKIVSNSLFAKLKERKQSWLMLANKNAKLAFNSFPFAPIDTGATQKGTSASVFEVNKNIIFRFITLNNNPSNDGKLRGYAIFPLLGRSTSAKYKERNWLKKSAKQTVINIIK